MSRALLRMPVESSSGRLHEGGRRGAINRLLPADAAAPDFRCCASGIFAVASIPRAATSPGFCGPPSSLLSSFTNLVVATRDALRRERVSRHVIAPAALIYRTMYYLVARHQRAECVARARVLRCVILYLVINFNY